MSMAHLIKDLSRRSRNDYSALIRFIKDPDKTVVQRLITFRLQEPDLIEVPACRKCFCYGIPAFDLIGGIISFRIFDLAAALIKKPVIIRSSGSLALIEMSFAFIHFLHLILLLFLNCDAVTDIEALIDQILHPGLFVVKKEISQ